ncbi:hypothetical protein AAFF_G00345990 [Aldrovandia affinis]|uniref:Uncharacterized protein n=1 Tax=Aldrovandia affinis TaxID=143900 RepID=A0AAD7SLN3_9TELE|nr:hypothetical protein AAFF_G00345990 [Aldrovandia affinis]
MSLPWNLQLNDLSSLCKELRMQCVGQNRGLNSAVLLLHAWAWVRTGSVSHMMSPNEAGHINFPGWVSKLITQDSRHTVRAGGAAAEDPSCAVDGAASRDSARYAGAAGRPNPPSLSARTGQRVIVTVWLCRTQDAVCGSEPGAEQRRTAAARLGLGPDR